MAITGKGNTYAADVLKLLLNGTAIDNIAANQVGVGTTTLPASHVVVALHETDPDEAGTQATGEADYIGYQRELVLRTTGGWTISGTDPASASPVATISFQAGTGGTGTVLAFTVGAPEVNTVTVSSATPGVITRTAHGYTANMRFTLGGTTAPTGTTFGTIYYVSATGLNANDFQFSATAGGASINTSSTGTTVLIMAAKLGVASKIFYGGLVTPNIVTGNGVTPQLTTASTITED